MSWPMDGEMMKSDFILKKELSDSDLEIIETLGLKASSKRLGGESGKYGLVSLSASKESVEVARVLEQARRELSLDKKGDCVSDGPSFFFSSKLYPMIYRYERGLRGAVILSFRLANADDARGNKIISKLEEYSLDDLMGKLLKSNELHSAVKKMVDADSYYEKQDLLNRVGGVNESLLWDRLFKEDAMPTVRAHHCDIRRFRNAIAHARQICFDDYEAASKLLKKANSEIDRYVRSLTGTEIENIEYQSLYDAFSAATWNETVSAVSIAANKIAEGLLATEALGRLTEETSRSLAQGLSSALMDNGWMNQLSDACKQLADGVGGASSAGGVLTARSGREAL